MNATIQSRWNRTGEPRQDEPLVRHDVIRRVRRAIDENRCLTARRLDLALRRMIREVAREERCGGRG